MLESSKQFGRDSIFIDGDLDGTFKLEAGGAPGRPGVERITFELQDELIKFVCKEKICPTSQSLSRSGNGYLFFSGVRTGLFRLFNIAATGRRMWNYYVIIKNGKYVASIHTDDSQENLTEFAKDAGYDFAQTINYIKNHKKKVAEVAERICESVKDERKAFSDVVLVTSEALNCVFEVCPVFNSMPSDEAIFKATQSECFNECEYVVQLAAPAYYKVKDKIIETEFGEYKIRGDSGNTVEDALSKTEDCGIAGLERTKADREKRAQEEADEYKKIESVEIANNWPKLAGSEKQIAWARKIRYYASQSNESNAALKKATTAKYWIDRRSR